MEPIGRQRGDDKTRRNPIKIFPAAEVQKKPSWIRARAPHNPRFMEIKSILRRHGLHSVCEEASCPNIGECFGKGTATFMILGDLCTRRCPFCDVAHGRPEPPDAAEPGNLARVIAELRLRYVVITSVDRDDLPDGGAGHFAACIAAARQQSPQLRIEILAPDFRGRMERALMLWRFRPPMFSTTIWRPSPASTSARGRARIISILCRCCWSLKSVIRKCRQNRG